MSDFIKEVRTYSNVSVSGEFKYYYHITAFFVFLYVYIYKELEYIDTWNILMRLNLEQTVRRRNLFFIIIIHLKIVVPVTNAFLGHILALILQRNKARKTCLNIHISY